MSDQKTGKACMLRYIAKGYNNMSVRCIVVWMHRRPCRKMDFDNNECVMPAGEYSLFKNDSWKPSHFRGQIHNAEIPRGSTCLLIRGRTHFFSQTHTLTVCRARRGCCWGAEWGPLSLRVFVPLSWVLPPSDDGPIVRATSGPAPFRPADKAPFHKTKAGKEGGRKGREGTDGSVERQRRWGEGTQQEAIEG